MPQSRSNPNILGKPVFISLNMRGQPLALTAGVASARFGPVRKKSAMLYTRHPCFGSRRDAKELQSQEPGGYIIFRINLIPIVAMNVSLSYPKDFLNKQLRQTPCAALTVHLPEKRVGMIECPGVQKCGDAPNSSMTHDITYAYGWMDE